MAMKMACNSTVSGNFDAAGQISDILKPMSGMRGINFWTIGSAAGIFLLASPLESPRLPTVSLDDWAVIAIPIASQSPGGANVAVVGGDNLPVNSGIGGGPSLGCFTSLCVYSNESLSGETEAYVEITTDSR